MNSTGSSVSSWPSSISAEPRHVVGAVAPRRRGRLLVPPVRGDAVLGGVVHLAVRIWISSGRPVGPITVVWIDW